MQYVCNMYGDVCYCMKMYVVRMLFVCNFLCKMFVVRVQYVCSMYLICMCNVCMRWESI